MLGEIDLHSSVKDPSPTILTFRKKEENVKTVEDKNGASQLKSIGPALKTRQFHTIEYGVSMIGPQ